MNLTELLQSVQNARVYDLGQPYYVGMPHHPLHPPFLFSLSKKHGDQMRAGGPELGGGGDHAGRHVGTHIDALCHFSCGGKMHGGIEADAVQSYGGGLEKLSVDTVAPILQRGVLLDFAGHCRAARGWRCCRRTSW